MAEFLPTALKIPEISRFVNRANQLRSIKPAIAYWCEYHAVNQIVGKSLHSSDDDAFLYTKTLIERLETTKTEHATEEAIVDNDVAKAYVEQFAQQTFNRAERTMHAGKVTRQTADTFDAAATFFDVLREWGDPEPEVLQKIKFAKWNAARILKAIREGKDPNESNPTPVKPREMPALDLNDPEVQELTSPGAVPPKPVSVEDAVDVGEPPKLVAQDDYFPAGSTVPQTDPTENSPSPLTPPAQDMPFGNSPSTSSQVPLQPSPHIPTKVPREFISPVGPPPEDPSAPDFIDSVPLGFSDPDPPEVLPESSFASPAPTPTLAHVPAPSPTPAVGSTTANFRDINQAQKHAKWAISALNFEDVPTAIGELRKALAALGSQ
ncbi:vacuolar protein sorting-associated protein VTA1 [Geosmithia morbida]|uniref:Vacuolar protein sorting-associated protein VTA1 n=1 Tax=Geosmithia morbida TaxID=1094350 RepID=A0A9P5D3E2_9HYPO|nr:vacuolar protein sorting-associated protein VTA1 [Geosmithia morbida]KAF4124847.1 vacuolar protein sorting-associated protein VTA1 [Geosmithia morbida]